MVKAVDPICNWCKKPDSRCVCDAAANAFAEPAALKVSKTVPGVDALTFLMEILGLAMFLIGFTLFCGLIALAIFASRETNSPAFGAMISFLGFFSTFGIMLSGSIMYLLARINHRLWST